MYPFTEKRNALKPELMFEIDETINPLSQDESVRVVIIREE